MKLDFKIEKLKKSKKSYGWIVKSVSVLALWFFVIGSILFLSYFIYLQRTIPDPETIITRKVGESTKIYDSTGEILLYDIHGEEKRTIVPWEDISDFIKKATLASEDSDFYTHKGIDFMGMARAFIRNIQSVGISEGGSTITQQLVKKALLGDERSSTYRLVNRKIREIILTIEIERKFSKDELFWMYLNQIPYGSNAYGIEAASKTFFNKRAKDLTLEEAALLAALPQSTTYYSPYGSHVNKLMERKNWILGRMLSLGYIDQNSYDEVIHKEIVFQPGKVQLLAPHFVIMVKEYLASKYGEDALESNGFKVITTLDIDLQRTAEEVVSKYSQINKQKYKANNAALVAINPKTGELKSLVGSSDYFDIENDGNFNVATGLRQPGSAFKPFAYAALINNGYPDSTIIFDVKTEFNPNCNPNALEKKDIYGLDCYNPDNYDGKFRGPVTVRSSLAQSLNIPSVKVLYLAGINKTIDVAESMGISSLKDRARFGLSLVLGGAEVKLVDLVSAYGVFANDGIKNPWFFIKKIESSDGEVLEEYSLNPERVIPNQTARTINDILSDNNAQAPVFGHSSPLFIPNRIIAAKTGTTQENRDAWVVGYSPSLAVGIWSGNNDNRSMTREGAGISASGPMWHEFIIKALGNSPVEEFIKPDFVISDKTMLNGQYVADLNQDIHNILYYVDVTNPLGPMPLQPGNDVQFRNWEWAVRNYYNLPN